MAHERGTALDAGRPRAAGSAWLALHVPDGDGHASESARAHDAHIEKPDTVRIRVWEKGVGPTKESGSNRWPTDNSPTTMTLAAGSGLGPYQILAPSGRGGMGEIYRARDTRLGRAVAIRSCRSKFIWRRAEYDPQLPDEGDGSLRPGPTTCGRGAWTLSCKEAGARRLEAAGTAGREGTTSDRSRCGVYRDLRGFAGPVAGRFDPR